MNRSEILLKNTIDLLKEQLINNAEDIYIGGHYISPEEYFYNRQEYHEFLEVIK